MPLHPHGGARADSGRKKGVSVKPASEKVQSVQTRINAKLIERAAALGNGQGRSTREVIEELLDQHLPHI